MKKGGLLMVSVLLAALLGCGEQETLSSGVWRGGMTLQGQDLTVDLIIESGKAFISVPLQGLSRIPVQQLSLNPQRVAFRIPLPQGELRFQGRESKGRIEGTVLQGSVGGDFFLNHQTDGAADPGTPVADPPGSPGRDAAVQLTRDGLILRGRLRQPPLDQKHLAALIIAGSGPTDGDGNSLLLGGDNNSLLRLADFLADQGIPSLRFDKRGSGATGMQGQDEANLVFQDMIDDAEAWYLRLQEEFPNRNYVLMGHSQGSLIALAVAENQGAGAVVSLAGAGFPLGKILRSQLGNISEEVQEQVFDLLSELESGRRISDLPRNLPREIQGLFRPSVQDFLISYLSYDPREIVARLACPVLIVQGGRDRQVGVAEGESLLAAQPEAEYLFLEDMNHLLRDVTDTWEDQRSYAEDRLPLSPGLKKGLSDFLKRSVEDE